MDERGAIELEPRRYDVWGSELSPFTLKVEALLAYCGVPLRRLPTEGGSLENLWALRRVGRVKARRLPLTYPPMTELDEFPLVPYVLGPDGVNLYDSTAVAEWLDATRSSAERRLLPGDALPRFVVRSIDEYFDEFGLYMAHHARWVTSAHTNDAGARLAGEFRSLVVPPLRRRFAERFSARQVRRLPYLFSVATSDDAVFADLPPDRRPPKRDGFPATHELLDHAFARMLRCLEHVLAEQDFLLGARFTLADASAYGQLAMNLQDPSAAQLISRDAPRTRAWLARIAHGGASEASRGGTAPTLTRRLEPLLEEIARTFVPLMKQNEAAYERHRAKNETVFNEAAFDAGRALYDGELCDSAFRSVVKTFQVRVWRSLMGEWGALDPSARKRLPWSM